MDWVYVFELTTTKVVATSTKKRATPIQTERSTSPHLRRSSWSWAPNYESLLFFHASKSGLIPYLIRTLLVFELVINGRLNWYPFGMRCEHFHF